MKKITKSLALILTCMLIFSVASVSITAYAASSGNAVGQYDYKIKSTYETVDWNNWKAYKGATHVHTVRSDGNIELNDMIEKYYELGYDALALTDHGTVNYSWTKNQDRLTIFGYQYFVHGQVDELTTKRYTEITTGTGVAQGAVAPRGYGMTEIPLGIELNGMSTSKCHINGYYADAGHGVLATSETWPRAAVKTNYDAGGITHINHVGEWADAKNNIGVYSAAFINDFASIYLDYCPNYEGYTGDVRGCIGVELVNTADSRTRNDRYLYDETMKILAPRGINMYGFCEDDSHDFSDCDRNAQFFLMPSNDTQAQNIKTSMVTGAFYTSSKNSRGVYELGNGFVASGEYPSISNIVTDDQTSQIRVTVKNADKARMVADGAIIETFDIRTNENTVVFDLNNYEDKINSYVRIYFTGPGGITYLQPFLLTKTQSQVSTVKFNVPSSDTSVKVYDAAGAIVTAANTSGVYILDPGNYTYIASRPGYLTTDAIPFTVTQSDIDNAVKRVIDVTLEENSEAVFTTFYVPETIYLNPHDMKSFSSYIDRENVVGGELNREISSTGNVFFHRDGATDINISYEVVEGERTASLKLTRSTASTSTSMSASITEGTLNSAIESNSYALLRWTATYKCNEKTFTSYAYSYIYPPLTGTSSTAAAGGYAKTEKAAGWLHSTMHITATLWLTGVHSVTGGGSSYKFAPYGGQAVTSASGVGSLTQAGIGLTTASDESNGGSKTVYPSGAQANLTIDTSRHNNFNQIPNLSVGLDINSAVQCDTESDSSTQRVKFGETTLFELKAKATSLSGKRIFASDNTDAAKDIDVPISESQSMITISGRAAGYKSSRTDAVEGTIALNLSYVDKTDLRTQYENAIKYAYQSDWFNTEEEYNNYLTTVKMAAMALGDPTANMTEINEAKNSLTAYLTDVELKTCTGTVNYIDPQGNIIKTEGLNYVIGDTIILSADELAGYEYANSFECLNNDNTIKAGNDTYCSLMAVQDSYTFNFYYNPISYQVSFISSDTSYAPIGGTGTSATYNSLYALPSNIPSENGYTFKGWNFSLDNQVYPAGAQLAWSYAQNGSFIATWEATTYEAIYDTNGGSTLSFTSENVQYSDTYDVTEEIPTKEGYVFAGWKAVAYNGQNLGIQSSGSRFTWEYPCNVTFTAEWKVLSCAVTLNPTGGTLATTSLNVTYGNEYGELPEPIKTGYVFTGWYTDETYTFPVTASTVVTATTDHTLYAKWSKGQYNVNYYVDGEFYSSDAHEYGDNITLIAAPSKVGYTFSGWSEIPQTMPSHDINVYGSFTANKYEIIYYVDLVEYKRVEKTYSENIVAEPEPTKTGHTFSGWIGLPQNMPANNVSVNGYFSPNEYTVTYYIDNTLYATQKYKYGEKIVPQSEPTKTGYTFSGWSNIPETMPDRNISVNATFTAQVYTISYYVDGELYFTQECEYGEAITLIDDPQKAGYSFSGWTTAPETMPARNITVNGKFTKNQYSYLFVIDGQMQSDLTIRAYYGDPITAPVPDCPENYQFSGWSPAVPEKMGDKAQIFNGTMTKITSDIAFNINGATGRTPTASKYSIGESVTLPDSSGFSKAGYKFEGWSQNPAATTGVTTLTVTSEDITLYAVWSMVIVSIEPAKSSNTQIDNETKLISGLNERLTESEFESSYISLIGENADIKYTNGLGFGTGTIVELKNTATNKVTETYAIVIFGDLDGDGVSDGQDVMLAKMLADGVLTKDDVSPAVFEAADCNHDSQITDDDVNMIINSGLLSYKITQVK